MRKSLMLFLIVPAAIAAPSAEDTTAWFGTTSPAPLSDPRKPVMKYDDAFGPLPASFPHRPGKPDEVLDGAALKADQKRIVGGPRHRDGGREQDERECLTHHRTPLSWHGS